MYGRVPLELASVAEAFFIAGAEEGEVASGEVFGAMEGAGERRSGEMALGGSGQVAMPNVFEGVVEADAFEAVVEADGPAVLAGKGGESVLGEVLEAGDLPGFFCGAYGKGQCGHWRRTLLFMMDGWAAA